MYLANNFSWNLSPQEPTKYIIEIFTNFSMHSFKNLCTFRRARAELSSHSALLYTEVFLYHSQAVRMNDCVIDNTTMIIKAVAVFFFFVLRYIFFQWKKKCRTVPCPMQSRYSDFITIQLKNGFHNKCIKTNAYTSIYLTLQMNAILNALILLRVQQQEYYWTAHESFHHCFYNMLNMCTVQCSLF